MYMYKCPLFSPCCFTEINNAWYIVLHVACDLSDDWLKSITRTLISHSTITHSGCENICFICISRVTMHLI